MRDFLRHISGLFAFILISQIAFSQTQQKQQTVQLPQGISDSWYQQTIEQLKEREYFIKPLAGSNGYAAANRTQQAGFLFTENGYTIKRFDFDNQMAPMWEYTFAINGIGRNTQISLQPRKRSAAYQDKQLNYQYSGFDVEYINSKDGMRQNFVVKQKPAGEGDLRVSLQLKGSLAASMSSSNKLVMKDSKQNTVLYYDDLKVWDANHQLLKAHMELSKDGQELGLVVDDSHASYPVTIDPLNHIPDWTDNGNGLIFPLLNDLATPLLFGFSVSGAGDVNNDTYDDIIIGAPAYVDIVSISGGTFNLVSVGAAFIYYGGSGGLSSTPSEALQPTSFAGALFGFSVSRAGDVNGDGYDDVIVGAPGDHTNLTVAFLSTSVTTGKAYIYYGNSFDGSINSEPAVTATIQLKQADFGVLGLAPVNPLYGFSVSEAGDVNNDGYADVIVGSPGYLNLLSLTLLGRADVYYGSSTGISANPDRTIKGGLIGGLFGFSVSAAGKVNNDVYDDIIIGAPASINILAVGSAYVFHGSSTGITATSTAGAATTLQASGLLDQTLFGYSVSKAGDVNADGRGDVIVGEPLALEGVLTQTIAVGKATIFYGSTTGIQTSGSTALSSPRAPSILGLIQGNLLYGFSVSYAGDMNCDGIDDVIVGEPGGTGISLGGGLLGLTSTNALSGKAYVYYGRTTTGPVNSPSWMVQDNSALSVANLIGASVSDAGDVNGDGHSDILVGAPNGTFDLSGSLIGLVGDAVDILTVSSIGSAYTYHGCLTNTDLDFDNDGIPDAVDLDDDNDGIPDTQEYPGLSLSSDPSGDDDGDGIPNYKDSDFTSCGGINGNAICSSFDKDGDGIPNSMDLDSVNDGIPDVIEAGGVDSNGDGILDNFTDTDGDGLSQSIDANNTGAAGSGTGLGNPDFDGDGIPNSSDLDSDNDGITDLREAGLPDTDNDGHIDSFADSDGDGFANSADPSEGHSGSGDPAGIGTPALTTPADTNNDGRYNGNPATGNADNDAKFNFLDIDSDNDGITDNVEAQSTAGYVLPGVTDTDGDGLLDIYDSQGGVYSAGGITPYNYDGTDNPDYLDLNSDNDSQSDAIEGHDFNGNGVPDDNVSLTGIDTDNDGLDDRFDMANGPNVTTQGMGNPPIPGSAGPLQAHGSDKDFRNILATLPLKLLSFSGKVNGAAIKLDWKTTLEINNSHFEILRSGDGVNFISIGSVRAVAISADLNNYSFTDQSPLNGKNFYRLKIVSNDNKIDNSQIILLQLNSGKERSMEVFPNPVTDYFQVALKNIPAADYRIDIIQANGQTIKTMQVVVNSTYEVLTINKENTWSAGLYMIRMTGNGNTFSKTVVVK